MAQARAEAEAEEAAERAAAPVLEARAAAIEGDRHARALLGWWDEDELAAALAREECPESFAPTPPVPVASVPGPPGRAGCLAQDLPAGVLAQMAPDAQLAVVLEGVEVAALDPFAAVEVVAAFKRVEAWAAGQAALAAAELARMPAMSAQRIIAPGVGEEVNGTSAELAMRLATTRAEARRLVAVGAGLRGAFAQTGEALLAGVIDWRKAATIVSTLGPVADEVAWSVQHDVLAGAAGRTHNQIGRDLARELVKVDPEEAAARHARAVRGQHVTHPRALADGMASMYIVAGAEDAVPFDLLLTNAARAARADGDSRSVEALRAEALFALATGALHTGVGACQFFCVGRVVSVLVDVSG
ncbi:DUF222 domain-containing protein [Georgenia thermotolerans]|nr:DUF222 domain-containing protein [Georgenia thermotolerans]